MSTLLQRLLSVMLGVLVCGALTWAAPVSYKWTLANPGGAYTNELFRLPVTLKTPYDANTLTVTEDGAPVSFQVEVQTGTRKAVTVGAIWVCTTVAAGGTHDYVVTQPNPADAAGADAAGPADGAAPPRVQVEMQDDDYVLDNGVVSVRIPAQMTDLRGPIVGVKASTGDTWLGSSTWNTQLKLSKFTATLIGDGTLFAKIRLRYTFTATAELTAPTADIIVRLAPGQPFVSIEESHQMAPEDYWTLDMGTSWAPNTGLSRGWYYWDPNPYQPPTSMGGVKPPLQPPGARPDEKLHTLAIGASARGYQPDTMMSLLPRWTTLVDNGWFYSASDGTQLLGVLAARAGKWEWPNENKIAIKTSAAAPGSVSAAFPTSKGRRFFFLMAGPRTLADSLNTTVINALAQPLDKLVNEYLMAWPGAPTPPATYANTAWNYAPMSPFESTKVNPSGVMRTSGTTLLNSLRLGTLPLGGMNLVGSVNTYLDPDFFPGYWNRWSPQQPTYPDDALRIAMAQCTSLKSFPQFKELSQRVADAYQADVDANVTLPGGAGIGSPGQLYLSLKSWLGLPAAGTIIQKGSTFGLVDVARKYLGFDPMTWPRIKAAVSFLNKTSVPFSGTLTSSGGMTTTTTGAGGTGRRILPVGDTAYPGLASTDGGLYATGQDDFAALMNVVGLKEDVTQYTSEELPGFGAIMRENSGAANESFLAFMAGPNRFGMSGDALSFIYCTTGKRLAVDHMSAGQYREDEEHMHNRVALFKKAPDTQPTPPAPPISAVYYNMDGYPRLIAFKSTPTLDVAIGQVETTRLREVLQKPALSTQAATASKIRALDKPVIYRRTIMLVKGLSGGDVVIIRDQLSGVPADLTATFCLQHPSSTNASRNGNIFDLGNARLWALSPTAITYERMDWTWSSGYGYAEKTDGIRISQKGEDIQFLTVLAPYTAPIGGAAPPANAGAMLAGNTLTINDGKVASTITLADPGTDTKAAVVTHVRGTANTVLLTGADVDLNRSQGKISLYRPENEDLNGPMPDWLLAQRDSPVAKSTWNW